MVHLILKPYNGSKPQRILMFSFDTNDEISLELRCVKWGKVDYNIELNKEENMGKMGKKHPKSSPAPFDFIQMPEENDAITSYRIARYDFTF